MKKSMVTKKEEALLRYMYDMAKDLHDFIKKNGYTQDDFCHCNIHINIGEKADIVESNFTEFYTSGGAKRSVSYFSVGGRRPVFDETNWREKE